MILVHVVVEKNSKSATEKNCDYLILYSGNEI